MKFPGLLHDRLRRISTRLPGIRKPRRWPGRWSQLRNQPGAWIGCVVGVCLVVYCFWPVPDSAETGYMPDRAAFREAPEPVASQAAETDPGEGEPQGMPLVESGPIISAQHIIGQHPPRLSAPTSTDFGSAEGVRNALHQQQGSATRATHVQFETTAGPGGAAAWLTGEIEIIGEDAADNGFGPALSVPGDPR